MLGFVCEKAGAIATKTLLRKGPSTGSITKLHGDIGRLLPGLAAACVLAGCASQGPLRPPSLYVPAQVRGLAADRVGDAVDLRWTTPTRTTDGLPLSGKHVPVPLQAEVCREDPSVPNCLPLGRIAATGTHTGSFHDVLPPSLASGSPRILHYRVRMLNGSGKGAAAVTVEALAGTAPPILHNVQVAPVENGVLLRWQPTPDIEDGRILLRVRRGDAAVGSVAPARSHQQDSEQAKSADTLLSVEVKGNDPAGTLDTGAKSGVAQQYTLARERVVRVGGEELSMRSSPVLIQVPANAKLPLVPPPTGLEAVANTLNAPEIDLVWQPATAATGYRVFRTEGAGTSMLLTVEPVRGLTYTDTAVRPGARYRYSVSSVGRDGIAGPKSSEVEEGVPDR